MDYWLRRLLPPLFACTAAAVLFFYLFVERRVRGFFHGVARPTDPSIHIHTSIHIRDTTMSADKSPSTLAHLARERESTRL